MNEVILIKLGELVLKGLNRNTFEAALLRNLRRRLSRAGEFEIRVAQSTVYVIPRAGSSLDDAVERVSRIFGIAAFSRACAVEKDLSAMEEAAAQYLRPQLLAAKTFKVETKRADKQFPLKSPEISAAFGEFLLERYPHLRVDVHEPDLVVRAEVRDFGAYVHGQPRRGAGGIPVGTGGNAAVLISGGIDSPVAAWMMAKRGLELTAVHFASPPYTSERAEQKVVDLLTRVSEYAGRMTLFVVPFARVQEEIRAKCPEDYFTLIMRRFMMRIAGQIARREDCAALITGESLGQVASQTLQAIVCTDEASEMPVFRPLIGMDKTEIIEISRRIETFDVSIEPFEDCCTVFTPKHPRTHPHLRDVLEAERPLDGEALIRECVQNARPVKIYPRA